MSLWETLGTMTSPGGLFHGYTPAEIWAMLETLYLGQCMRRTTDGYLVNVTQRGMFEDTVRQRYGLTNAQYVTITQLYDQGEAGPCFAASGAHLEMPIPGIPGYVGRYLAVDKTTCCNGTLKVTWMLTVVYERARSYTARHVVKRCVVPGGCRSTYYHNKRTVPAEVDGAPGRWHVFYPFSDGEIPLFITNKSGRSAISSALLTDSAIKICKLG